MTKFDTVDEKVGTALNMVYTTGKPIVFVGVGQKYPHLKKLNVQTVIGALMSWADSLIIDLLIVRSQNLRINFNILTITYILMNLNRWSFNLE